MSSKGGGKGSNVEEAMVLKGETRRRSGRNLVTEEKGWG